MKSKFNVGYLYLLVTFFCWGSIYIVSKYALAVMGPITVCFCRYAISIVCLYGLLKLKGGAKKVEKDHWPYFLLLGGLGYFVSIVLQLAGTSLLSASLSSLMNALNPVSISILAAIFLKEKLSWKNGLSILISLAGVYIILGSGGAEINPLGILCAAGSVLLWSTASVAIRKISGFYDPVQTALYGMMIAIVLNLPAAIFENVFMVQSHPTMIALLACLFLGVFGTAVAHTCWNKGLSCLNASTCSMFYPLQPLVSAVLGVLILHEHITWQFVVGAILICCGIVVNFLPTGQKTAEKAD